MIIKTNTDPAMTESQNLDLFQKLLAQIERAWFDRGDRNVIHELTRKHPEFQAELQEFFEDLTIDAEADDNIERDIIEAEDRVYEWLQTAGIDEALALGSVLREQTTSASESSPSMPQTGRREQESSDQKIGEGSPETWLMFLRRQTGSKRAEIASSLPNVTLEFLSLVSRYSRIIPDRVKLTLAQSAQERLGLPLEQSFECLSAPAPLAKRAASRRLPADRDPVSFEEILERAALSAAQKDFWRRCAEGNG